MQLSGKGKLRLALFLSFWVTQLFAGDLLFTWGYQSIDPIEWGNVSLQWQNTNGGIEPDHTDLATQMFHSIYRIGWRTGIGKGWLRTWIHLAWNHESSKFVNTDSGRTLLVEEKYFEIGPAVAFRFSLGRFGFSPGFSFLYQKASWEFPSYEDYSGRELVQSSFPYIAEHFGLVPEFGLSFALVDSRSGMISFFAEIAGNTTLVYKKEDLFRTIRFGISIEVNDFGELWNEVLSLY